MQSFCRICCRINDEINFSHSKIVLGKVVSNDAELDLELAYTLLDLGRDLPFDVVTGKTVCTNDFYEGNIHLFGYQLLFQWIVVILKCLEKNL